MKYGLTLLVILSGLLSNAQTLEDYITMAADSNAGLKASYYSYHAALTETDEIGLPDPEIGFGYFVSPIETRLGPQQFKISAMQMFPWFGTIDAHKKVKSELAMAKFKSFEAKRNELVFNVKSDYYKLFKLEKDIGLFEEHLEILKTYRSLAIIKIETGNGSAADLLRIDIEVDELKNMLITLKEKKLVLQARFNQYLNRPASEAVILTDSLTVIDLQVDPTLILDSIELQNNQLVRIQYLKSAMQAKEVAAEKEGAPMIGFGLNYISINERTDMNPDGNGRDAFIPMVSLRIPLYRRKYKAKVQEVKINQNVIQCLEEEHINMLHTKFEMTMAEYHDADRRIDLYQRQMERAVQIRDILIESYSTSGKDFEEILRIQRMLLNFEQQIILAVVDKNIAVAQIEVLY